QDPYVLASWCIHHRRVEDVALIDPFDLVVHATRFGTQGCVSHRSEVEYVEPPAVVCQAFKSNAGVIGGKGWAFDMLVEHAGGTGCNVPFDQIGCAACGQRGVETIAVCREGDIPEVEFWCVDDLPIAPHGKLL